MRPDAPMTLDQMLGTDRESIVNWLTSHEEDGYYLGTPFPDYVEPYDASWCMRPNGRFADNMPQMNCAGFVADVFLHAGVSEDSLYNMVDWVWNWMDYDYGWDFVDADFWFLYAVGHAEIRTYRFDSIEEALASGILQKGDLIYFSPSEASLETGYDSFGNVADPHIGFFWGNTPNEDKFWQSADGGSVGVRGADQVGYGNQISVLSPCSESSVYVIPLSDPKEPAVDEVNFEEFTEEAAPLTFFGKLAVRLQQICRILETASNE